MGESVMVMGQHEVVCGRAKISISLVWPVSSPSVRSRSPGRDLLSGPRYQCGVLDESWPGPAGTRVRLARASESADFERLVGLARVPVEGGVADLIKASAPAELLMRSFRSKDRTFLQAGATRSATREEVLHFFARVALPLVAVDSHGAPIGALQGVAPAQMAAKMLRLGWPLESVTSLAIRVGKVAAVAVEPNATRQGVGRALLDTCREIYFSAGYRLVFGNFRRSDPPHLENFYRGAGFEISEKPVTIGVAGGFVVDVGVDSDQRMFTMKRSAWTRANRQD